MEISLISPLDSRIYLKFILNYYRIVRNASQVHKHRCIRHTGRTIGPQLTPYKAMLVKQCKDKDLSSTPGWIWHYYHLWRQLCAAVHCLPFTPHRPFDIPASPDHLLRLYIHVQKEFLLMHGLYNQFLILN